MDNLSAGRLIDRVNKPQKPTIRVNSTGSAELPTGIRTKNPSALDHKWLRNNGDPRCKIPALIQNVRPKQFMS
ncbi:hypothetical protein TMRH483_02759 [Qipengyuania sp. 483]